MAKKLTQREIFDYVFKATQPDPELLKLLEEDPAYKDLKEYYESLKKLVAGKTKDDISEIARKLTKDGHSG
ncbi:MAG: hypothetical protein ACM3QX_11075 [Syntrophomonadaceae bacterium]